MRASLPSLTFGLLLAGLLPGAAQSQNTEWPTWRGPEETGAAPAAKGLPDTWEGGKNITWSADLPGPGAGTPIVANGKVYLPSVDGGDVVALCFDDKTGKQLWKQKVGPNQNFPRKGNAAQPSAVTDLQRVYFLTGSGWLAAFTLDGKEVWKNEVKKSLGEFKQNFGYGASPVVMGDKVLLANLVRPSNGKSYVAAYDAKTGKEVWKVDRPTEAEKESPETYASLVPLGGDRVLCAGGDALTVHDLKDGKEIARLDYGNKKKRQRAWRLVATPTAQSLKSGAEVFFLEPRGGRLTKYVVKGDKISEEWSEKGKLADVPCPLLYDGKLYILNGRDRVLYAFDPETGKELWKEKLPLSGPLRASPVGADGKVYCVSEDGVVTVFKAGDKAEQVASFKSERFGQLATLAVAGNAIYLRDEKQLSKVAK